MMDQAEKLRQFVQQAKDEPQIKKESSTKIITVTSGKGGVGKSNFTINFAIGLSRQGKKVLIWDLDIGFANIDILMGLSPKRTLKDILEQGLAIWDSVEHTPYGFDYIAGGNGFTQLIRLDEHKLSYLTEQLNLLQGHVDYIILDTGAGLSEESLQFLCASDEIFLVCSPEPTALTDAYAVIKMVHLRTSSVPIQVIVNRCYSQKEGQQTFEKLSKVTEHFLKKEIKYLGLIPDDAKVSQAVRQQTPFLIAYPTCTASNAIEEIVGSYHSIDNRPSSGHKGMKGFLQRLFQRFV